MVYEVIADPCSLLIAVGEKVVRKCPMLEGVTIAEGSKDELVISGNDIENVSQSAASITDKCRVKEKDVSCHGDKVGLLHFPDWCFCTRLRSESFWTESTPRSVGP